ncbi:MAG: hypothetical protein HY690_12965 [Chloroflexi bacterium]|nr:hypothetical protein [Chloroflexota bacterium]
MHRQGSRVRPLRVLLGVLLAIAGLISLRTALGPTWAVMLPSELALVAREAPVAAAAPRETMTGKTIYPGQATWAWISSEDHEGSPEVLIGTPCTKCHEDAAVQSAFWPTWAAPPSDHKQSLGCQTCHGILPKPEGVALAQTKAGTREPR